MLADLQPASDTLAYDEIASGRRQLQLLGELRRPGGVAIVGAACDTNDRGSDNGDQPSLSAAAFIHFGRGRL
jgi:hypothetical protein